MSLKIDLGFARNGIVENEIENLKQFSDKSAQIIARETGIVVKKISPLDPNWSENLINIANEIGNK